MKVPAAAALCGLFTVSFAASASTLYLESSVSGPLSGIPSLTSYTDFKSLSRTYTLLVTGGTGGGYVMPVFDLDATADFCAFQGCSVENGGAEATVFFNGAWIGDTAGALTDPVHLDPLIPFTFGVAQTWIVELQTRANVGSFFGDSHPESSSSLVIATASFSAPTGCFSSGSLGTQPCSISLVDPDPPISAPEPSSAALTAAALALAVVGPLVCRALHTKTRS